MRRTFWPCLVAATVLLAGCSGKPAPKEPDTTSTPSPTATPPPLPEAATHETAEGAASFVDHYLDVLNYSKRSGAPEALSELSDSSCTGCQRLVETIKSTYARDGTFHGGEWSVADLSVTQLTTVWSATGAVKTTPGYQIPQNGADRRESAGTTTDVEFQIAFDGERWTMKSMSEPAA